MQHEGARHARAGKQVADNVEVVLQDVEARQEAREVQRRHAAWGSVPIAPQPGARIEGGIIEAKISYS